jgi:hypothetical protein
MPLRAATIPETGGGTHIAPLPSTIINPSGAKRRDGLGGGVAAGSDAAQL